MNCPYCKSPNTKPHLVSVPAKYEWRKCIECDMIWNASYASREYQGNYFYGFAGSYEGARFKRILTSCRRLLLIYPYSPKGRFIDIGCSLGYVVQAAGLFGYEAEGLDISKEAIEYCNKIGLKGVCGDAMQLPYPDGHFSAITMINSLEHVPDVAKCMAEVSRVTADGGTIMVVGPNAGYIKSRYPKYHMWDKPDHIVTFTYPFLKRLMKDNGFRIVNPPVYSLFRALLSFLHFDKNVTVIGKKVQDRPQSTVHSPQK